MENGQWHRTRRQGWVTYRNGIRWTVYSRQRKRDGTVTWWYCRDTGGEVTDAETGRVLKQKRLTFSPPFPSEELAMACAEKAIHKHGDHDGRHGGTALAKGTDELARMLQGVVAHLAELSDEGG